LIGWFDDLDQMARAYDLHAGSSAIALDGADGFRTVAAIEREPAP
jgi:hypothetical protein